MQTQSTEERIIEAAIRTFVRYGARKAAMADIASEAGVSRQTLYDTFGGKDELIRSSIRLMTDRSMAAVRDAWSTAPDLGAKLDAYFDLTVVKSFELLRSSGDAEDLIAGHNQAGRDEIKRSQRRHVALVTELLTPYSDDLAASGRTVEQMARFVVSTAMSLKYTPETREDLDTQLETLKILVLAAAG